MKSFSQGYTYSFGALPSWAMVVPGILPVAGDRPADKRPKKAAPFTTMNQSHRGCPHGKASTKDARTWGSRS